MSDQPGRLVADLDGSWLIVAAANGAARNPAWFHNIATHPHTVQMEVDGRTIRVTAKQLHGVECAQAWRQIAAAAPLHAIPGPRPTVSCRSSA